MTTTTEAIKTAMRLVQIDNFGHGQYQVRYYIPSKRAWWENHQTTRESALRNVFEARIITALGACGWSNEDAGAEAHRASYDYPCDWRKALRAIIKRRRDARATPVED
jgi:hypothetical protein